METLPEPVMQNPNKTKNRVPTDRELVSLRSIASSKSEFLKTIETQISGARATYEEIQARYEEQRLHLESILSELHTAKQYFDALKAQKTQMNEEMKELRGLLHPIRRLPVEALCHIFNETLRASKLGLGAPGNKVDFRQATSLSHVCQHWRAVVIGNPSFWVYITVDLLRPLEAIASYWERAMDRVKNAPAIVYLQNIGGKLDRGTEYDYYRWGSGEKHTKPLIICNLQQIKVISELHLETAPGYPITDALGLISKFPVGQVDLLEILGSDSANPGTSESWDWSAFLGCFPAFRELRLSTLGSIVFSPSPLFGRLTEIRIGSVISLDFTVLLQLCPTLQYMVIGPCYEGVTYNTAHISVTLPSLTVLEVTEERSFPWSAPIDLPRLSTLIYWNEYGEASESVLGFIQKHPSLTRVDTAIDGPSLEALARWAPQLLNLTISIPEDLLFTTFIDWAAAGLSGPAFPLLKALEIRDQWFVPRAFGLDDFEDLVAKRCLPSSHPDSRLDPGVCVLHSLKISLPTDFSGSRYMAGARILEGKPGRGEVSLSWCGTDDT